MSIFGREYRVSIYEAGSHKVISVPKGASLYQALRDRNIMHTTMCNGKGRCGKCQVQFVDTPEMPIATVRITKADRLHVGQMLLNNGYRLACRHSIARDIHITLPDSSTSNTVGNTSNTVGASNTSNTVGARQTPSQEQLGVEHYMSNEAHQQPAQGQGHQSGNPSAYDNAATGATHSSYYRDIPHLAAATMDDLVDASPATATAGITDGIVVYDEGDSIRILQYSASLDKILNDTSIPVSSLRGYLLSSPDASSPDASSPDASPVLGGGARGSLAAEFLHQAISEKLLPQVINRTLNIQHSDRIVCIIKEYGSIAGLAVCKDLFRLAFYGSQHIDGVHIEYLQPLAKDTTSLNLEHFLLLSNLHPNGTLILSTQHTDRVYYYAKSGYYEFSTEPLGLPISLELPEFGATNPIIGMRKGIVDVELFDSALPPNGITFEAMLQCIQILLERGFMDETYQFYPRGELSERLPLELALKVVAKSKGNRFNIYRSRHALVSVEGDYIRGVDKYSKAIRALIPLVAKEIAPLVGISIYTHAHIDSVAGFAQGLGIVDKSYHGKLAHTTYDGAMVGTNYFSATSVDEFATRYIKGISCVSISDVPGLAGLIS